MSEQSKKEAQLKQKMKVNLYELLYASFYTPHLINKKGFSAKNPGMIAWEIRNLFLGPPARKIHKLPVAQHQNLPLQLLLFSLLDILSSSGWPPTSSSTSSFPPHPSHISSHWLQGKCHTFLGPPPPFSPPVSSSSHLTSTLSSSQLGPEPVLSWRTLTLVSSPRS